MGDLTFMHAADVHLGRPFSGLSRSSEDLGKLFRDAAYRAWDRIVNAAVDRKVDFVTLGGDVFDGPNPPIRARMAFKDGIDLLYQADIPVFLVLGNHDPLSDFPDTLRSLPGLHLFGPVPEGIECSCPEFDRAVTIYGVSFERISVKENLVRKFQRDPRDEIAVGLVHANVAGIPGHDDYAPCSMDDLRAGGMDVWLLGHVHANSVLSDDPPVIYAGTSQGSHINESGPRGCYLVTVNAKGEADAEFISTAPVRWQKVDVDITGLSGEEEILDAVEDACGGLHSEDEFLEAFVVRINLRGGRAGDIGWSENGVIEVAELLTERLSRLPVPVFPESLRDFTRSVIDLDSLMKEEGFLAEFLKLCRRSAVDPESMEALIGPIEDELSRKQYRRYLRPDLDPGGLREDPEALAAFLEEVEQRIARMFLGAPDE